MRSSTDNTFRKTRDFVRRQAMLDGARGVLVAVSGGADSVALLDIFVRLRDAMKKQSGGKAWNLRVAHLNHLLRGRESDEDAEFVQSLAESAGLPFTLGSRDVRAYAASSKKSIEEAAREARYEFLLRVASESGCDRIATGHTMSDQAETFLMRLLRGSGLRGLAAMRPVVPAHYFAVSDDSSDSGALGNQYVTSSPHHLITSSPLLIRPLLGVTRKEIEAYCRARGLAYRDDSSNACLDYTRNRVRHEAMAVLRSISPRVVERLAKTAALIAGEEEALGEVADRLLDESRIRRSGWQEIESAGQRRFAYSVEALAKQPQGLLRRMIVEAIRRACLSVQGKARAKKEVGATHIHAVERLVREGASGDRVILRQGLEVWREFEALVFCCSETSEPEPASEAKTRQRQKSEQTRREGSQVTNDEKDAYHYRVDSARQRIEAGGIIITVSRRQPARLLADILARAGVEKQQSGIDWMVVALDEAALPEEIIVRPRRTGEVAQVAGRGEIIKLKKLMIDHKIPSSRRATHPVVTTPSGEYVWSPGLPPALRFAAHDKSTSLAILRASFA